MDITKSPDLCLIEQTLPVGLAKMFSHHLPRTFTKGVVHFFRRRCYEVEVRGGEMKVSSHLASQPARHPSSSELKMTNRITFLAKVLPISIGTF